MLLTRIDGAPEPTRDLVEDILQHACPRLRVSLEPSNFVLGLIEAEAWVELGLWLIGWELPEWDVHQLSRGDQAWNCSLCVRGLAQNWMDDVADFQHGSLSLAILGALVDAQLRKLEGRASSNVIILRPRNSLVPQIGLAPACRPDVLGLYPGQP